METHIFANLIISGVLATSVAHADALPSVEKSNSSLSAVTTQQVQLAEAQITTLNRHEAKSELNPPHAAGWQHYLDILQPSTPH